MRLEKPQVFDRSCGGPSSTGGASAVDPGVPPSAPAVGGGGVLGRAPDGGGGDPVLVGLVPLVGRNGLGEPPAGGVGPLGRGWAVGGGGGLAGAAQAAAGVPHAKPRASKEAACVRLPIANHHTEAGRGPPNNRVGCPDSQPGPRLRAGRRRALGCRPMAERPTAPASDAGDSPGPDPLATLRRWPRFGVGLGLARAQRLVAELAAEHRPLPPAIGVTGSNGKGSVSVMIAEILRAAGLRVGRFTSPHLWREHERIVVDGQPIDDDDLRRSAARAVERLTADGLRSGSGRPGAFEGWLAAALDHFARVRPDVLVVEAGIGGRMDPTRALRPRVCALTSIDLEHTALLGHTKTLIAFDKADLCARGGTIVTGPLPAALRGRLRAYATIRGLDLRAVSSPAIESHRLEDGLRLRLAGLPDSSVRLPLLGRHQADNFAVAVAAVRAWVGHSARVELGAKRWDAAIHHAAARIQLPGRLERLPGTPPIWIDVGHTPAAVEAVVATLDELVGDRPLVVVTGVSDDRDPAVVDRLLARATVVIATRARVRGGAPERIAARVAVGRRVECVEPVRAAVARACAVGGEMGAVVLVAGGLFVAAEGRAGRMGGG